MAEIQYYKKPAIVVLKGEEAITALNQYIEELRGGQAEELTEEQTGVMIKLAKGLISTIENESLAPESSQNPPLIQRLRKAICSNLPKILIPSPSRPPPSRPQ
ncbi:MAG: hypothetical protein JSV05_01865 [Candidatus Bathyarchaeota archaeon]|nr:MAG: hypothetical protein JSV05_01865 [Candidatus Bathyarchaeota archaeon]